MAKNEITAISENHPLSHESFNHFYDEVVEHGKKSEPTTLENRKPHVVAKVLWRLSQGEPVLRISREEKITVQSIRRIRQDYAGSLEIRRKAMAVVYADVANEYITLLQKKAENMHEDDDQLAAIQPDKLAVTVGILTDHSSKLAGMNTITIEHRKGATIDEAQATLAAIRAKVAERAREGAIEAEVVDSDY